MKWRRVRTGARWAGTLGCVLVAVAWAGSWYWLVHWTSAPRDRYASVTILQGAVQVLVSPSDDPPQLCFRGNGGIHALRLGAGAGLPADWKLWYSPGDSGGAAIIPLWLPFALMLVPTACLWWGEIKRRRAVRREMAGHCPTCGYDRSGLTDAKCPECGTIPTPASK